jgi:hypothetical protein
MLETKTSMATYRRPRNIEHDNDLKVGNLASTRHLKSTRKKFGKTDLHPGRSPFLSISTRIRKATWASASPLARLSTLFFGSHTLLGDFLLLLTKMEMWTIMAFTTTASGGASTVHVPRHIAYRPAGVNDTCFSSSFSALTVAVHLQQLPQRTRIQIIPYVSTFEYRRFASTAHATACGLSHFTCGSRLMASKCTYAANVFRGAVSAELLLCDDGRIA